jgi:hypothetical protein
MYYRSIFPLHFLRSFDLSLRAIMSHRLPNICPSESFASSACVGEKRLVVWPASKMARVHS